MNTTIDLTGLTPAQIQQIHTMIEHFKILNQQHSSPSLTTQSPNFFTRTQTLVKHYAKNRHLAEELIQERHE
ncbi:MAG: hypothetical protein EA395_13780 [Phormidium sp. GEM2.Bin31]|jgi:hypothetical protein|nr:hypothetical protein [Phormidium sp. BM_Day4_Bin.17]TVR06820.1 MAG: hypothetical protein EA395_13780 [Phormidium sp. GEM2.Bin31]UCJ14049.1 MAG: hypothetical protein JWS08_10175 [Phormidium sp. PBR-2020]